MQRLVRLLGLTLHLRSRPGRGSCFAVSLPQAMPAADAVLALPQDQPLPDVAGLTVGLIEDDAEGRDAMSTLLGCWGCRVVSAADGAALALACRALPGGRPQALLVDQRLQGGRTGPAEAADLCQRWQIQLPVLVVTGEPDWQALQSAGHDCLPKPVDTARLARWLAAARPAAANSRPAAPAQASVPEAAP